MYTNLTYQEESFTVATLRSILNDKHIPQKMQKPVCQIQEKKTKSVLKTLSVERAFLSSDAL